ncbi:hypothetical protein HI914_01193 [Erysiphe necator]|uniref:Uncharacterized protein n=1 Tax=Uncinula necator TaxID=52586 RepID=A0A0B1P405_UNCNE|nr:hypothetical protein HI914_01193 [Erysiphe necator]KHJ33013.1 hypothetical protein EV44_g2523 [Erysiphe necator]
MSISDSFIPESHSQDELDSLPSSEISDDSFSENSSDAQEEWEASLHQLEMVLTMVIVPYAGKYFGRKFAFWSWAKYMAWLHPVDVTISKDEVKSIRPMQTTTTLCT